MSESPSDVVAPVSNPRAESSPTEVGPPGSCESPPPAPVPARGDELHDPRVRLLQLAAELARSQNRKMLAEFLRLRRAI